MTDHTSFLQAIRANPDDDTPRLVYADWLEEQGDADRAEYIRGSIAWAKEQARKGRYLTIPLKLRQLLERYELKWLGKHRPRAGVYANVKDLRFDWRRGFPATLHANWIVLTERGEELFAAHPLVGLSLVGGVTMKQKELQQVARLDVLEMVRHFYADNFMMDDKEMAVLVAAPGLHRLERLSLRANCISRPTLALIARRFPHLTHLNLTESCKLTDTDLKALAAPGLANLQSLNLYECKLTVPMLSPLTKAPTLGNLRELVLRGNTLNDRALKALASSTTLTNLKMLDLARTEIGTPGVKALAASPTLRLEDLTLSMNRALTDEAVVALAVSPAMRGLRVLKLEGCKQLTDEAGQAILRSKHLRHLETLEMKRTQLSDDCKAALRKHFGSGVCLFNQ